MQISWKIIRRSSEVTGLYPLYHLKNILDQGRILDSPWLFEFPRKEHNPAKISRKPRKIKEKKLHVYTVDFAAVEKHQSFDPLDSHLPLTICNCFKTEIDQ